MTWTKRTFTSLSPVCPSLRRAHCTGIYEVKVWLPLTQVILRDIEDTPGPFMSYLLECSPCGGRVDLTLSLSVCMWACSDEERV
jgi:hypothetical protein